MTQHSYGRAVDPGSRRPARSPRGGCVPLRPLGLADILDGSFRAVRRNPAATLGLSAALAVVRVAVIAGLQLGAYRTLDSVQLELLGALVISAALDAVLTGMLTLVVTQDVLGVQITAGEVLRRVRGRFWALLGLALVITVGQGLALVPLFVLGIWLWGLWAVAVPAMMVERSTVRGALARSRRLVSGMWWRVWGIRVVGFLLTGLLSVLVSVPFLVLAAGLTGSDFSLAGTDAAGSVGYVLIVSVGSVLAATLTAPIRAGVDALLYLDLRMRREGLDIVLRQAPAPARPVTAPGHVQSAF